MNWPLKSFFLFWLLPFSLLANELAPPVLPAGVCVNIHFVRGHTNDLNLIAAAGFKFIRMDFGWAYTEQKRGEYFWDEYDELTRNLEQRGLSAIYILDYSNPLYESQVDSRDAQKTDVAQRDTASPQHPGSIAAYAQWAAAAVKHFHGKHIVWEIWNEPNGFFWKPRPNAEQYSALALAAAEAIRKSAPNVTLVGPALSGFQPPFMETFLKSGVLKYLDGISVHPYREPKHSPETAAGDYQKLRGLIEQYAPDDVRKKLPIISGEWGYSSKTNGVSLETQAAYAVRQQLFNLLSGVTLSIWYDWQNDGTDANEVEHNFGTVTDQLAPKPTYVAIKTMTHELAGFSIARRLPSEAQDFVLVLTNGTGHAKLAAWTTGEAHETTIKLISVPGGTLNGVTGLGQPFRPHLSASELNLPLEALPKYISVPAVAAP